MLHCLQGSRISNWYYFMNEGCGRSVTYHATRRAVVELGLIFLERFFEGRGRRRSLKEPLLFGHG